MASITAEIQKYDPSVDEAPYFESYTVEVEDDESGVISALQVLHVVNEQAPLAYDWCCHSGLCGRCAMKINGVTGLACWMPVTSDTVRFEPLTGFPIVRDLVVSKERAYAKIVAVDTSIKTVNPITELKPIDFDLYWNTLERMNMCRECMCCMSVCPALRDGQWNDYAGPAALAAIAQRHMDTIDESDRLGQAVFSGLFKCQECGSCSLVCPSKIPISEINIQMKKEARDRGFEYDPEGRKLH